MVSGESFANSSKGHRRVENFRYPPSFFSRWSRSYVQKALEDKRAVSIFIENIPAGWLAVEIFKEMSKVGVVIDVFIPGKLNMAGIRFGFVRFEFQGNPEHMVEKINRSRNINAMLVASMARSRNAATRAPGAINAMRNDGKLQDKARFKEGMSFAQVMYERKSDDVASGVSFEFNPVEECMHKLRACAFGVMKVGISAEAVEASLGTISNIPIKVKRLGGQYVLLAFPDYQALEVCMKHKNGWGSNFFDLLKPWEEGDGASHRECWLNIIGVPPHAWCDEFFRNIASRFGSFLKLANSFDYSNNLEKASILVLTTFKIPISRVFKVKIGSKIFDISVTESQELAAAGEGVSRRKGLEEYSRPRDESSKSNQSEDGAGKETQESSDPFGIAETIRRIGKGKAISGSHFSHSPGSSSQPSGEKTATGKKDDNDKCNVLSDQNNKGLGLEYDGLYEEDMRSICDGALDGGLLVSKSEDGEMVGGTGTMDGLNNPFYLDGPCLEGNKLLSDDVECVDLSLKMLEKQFRALMDKARKKKNSRFRQLKKMKKITSEGLRSVRTGDSSTQDGDIAAGNARAAVDSVPMFSSSSVEADATMAIGKQLGLILVGEKGEVRKELETMIAKERHEWVQSRSVI